MIELTKIEKKEYQELVIEKLKKMQEEEAPGEITMFIRDFFAQEGRSTPPRIARRFFEEVRGNRFSNVRLKGSRSAEGYLIKI